MALEQQEKKVTAERKTHSKPVKKKAILLNEPFKSFSEGGQNSPLLNQMKTEIRRLYGEKVNMVNTNYIMKPHEFKCLAKTLSKRLWNEEKTLQSVDELIYAVDLLCNGQSLQEEAEADEQTLSSKEAQTTIRFITSELNSLVPHEETRSTEEEGKSPLSSILGSLMGAKEQIKKELARAGHSTVESLVMEKTRQKNLINAITEAFSISPSDDILRALKEMHLQEERKQRDYIQVKEKNFECQKRHFDETMSLAAEKISCLESRNKELTQLLHEREDKASEVLDRGDALQQNILQIKQVLAEEELRIQQEREEYKVVKKTLIDYNKKMTKIVQELVERIKKEQRERDALAKMEAEGK
ncbi:hypothetical protein NERG_01798 [Nematocida ausubeli]|uniref:Uncharacterized protein n=1 Tax=Nematocida ausubeli (strain ATCC PRA-371 / ERTm2) TaxID=1913371 RepID=H8ZDX7_NEMA1|nr:hypothetical protein NERG_01798 [Nematocida ausubeli]